MTKNTVDVVTFRKAAVLKGDVVSRGIAVGRAHLLGDDPFNSITVQSIEPTQVDDELVRFRGAIELSRQQLQELSRHVEKNASRRDADIFRSHIQMLDDPYLLTEVEETLRRKRQNIEAVLVEVIRRFSDLFQQIDDRIIRARSADVIDVGRRVLGNLSPSQDDRTIPENGDRILVAAELVPSITVRQSDGIAGILTERGDLSSHAAILARSFHIPAIVNVPNLLKKVNNGDLIIVDGLRGNVVISPGHSTVRRYRGQQKRITMDRERILRFLARPARTEDGINIRLGANVGTPEEGEGIKQLGAEGVGLFRTEFLFMRSGSFPDEEEQYSAYTQMLMHSAGQEVTFRILDLGGDKALDYFQMGKAGESMLGLRGIRLLFQNPDLLKIQLRALLRAAGQGAVRILVPMVTRTEEMVQLRQVMKECADELAACRIPHRYPLPVGMMIEVPSTLFLLEELAENADFFSVGTNDLIQYLYAVNRNLREVSYLYNPFDPAILRVLARIADFGAQRGRRVSICGEIAGDPYFTRLLLALGYRELSMNSGSIPLVRKIVQSSSLDRCRILLQQVMKLKSGDETARMLREDLLSNMAKDDDVGLCLI